MIDFPSSCQTMNLSTGRSNAASLESRVAGMSPAPAVYCQMLEIWASSVLHLRGVPAGLLQTTTAKSKAFACKSLCFHKGCDIR